MELSLVLWNCNGTEGKAINGNRKPPKATVDERKEVFNSTYTSWNETNMMPTVLLAQELYSGGLTKTWRDLSKKSNSFGECHAACFFLKNFGNETTFLNTGDLTRIMESILQNNRYNDGIGRIHCGIITIGTEKILICSWHGQYKVTDTKKKESLRKLLIFVDKIKSGRDCVAALVGGDFNLSAYIARLAMWKSVGSSAVLYDNYEKPNFRQNIIDYVIVWPKNRFILRKCEEIKTVPEEKHNADPRIFDHALIRYEFTVNLEGEWEGDGDVTWCGECGEGKVTLWDNLIGPFSDLEVNGVVSGQWEGSAENGHCRNFHRVEITGIHCMKLYITNKWVDVENNTVRTLMQNEAAEVWWIGSGRVKWESAGKIELKVESIKGGGRQLVEWNGTGTVKWEGEGNANWVGGKLEKWKGNQTVKWTGDQTVRWSGGGKVIMEGGELEYFSYNKCNWTPSTEFGAVIIRTWCARGAKSKELILKGQGVLWEVSGEGTGEII